MTSSKKSLKRKDIVQIEWIDSVGDGRGWVFEDEFDFEEHDNAMFYMSVGYFIKKTKLATYICLSMRKKEENGGSNLGRILAIPNKAILSIEKIGEEND